MRTCREDEHGSVFETLHNDLSQSRWKFFFHQLVNRYEFHPDV